MRASHRSFYTHTERGYLKNPPEFSTFKFCKVHLTIFCKFRKVQFTMLEELFEIQVKLASHVPKRFKRFLYQEINWEGRCIGIVGARGVGKTTLVLQYYAENYFSPEKCLYLLADHVIVVGYGLYRIAKEFFSLGGKAIIFDEIHKYPQWSQELKNIYDSFPDKKIIFTGSSSLHIFKEKADLSRRAVIYELPGLSFREFLSITENGNFGTLSLEEILEKHTHISSEVSSKVPVRKLFKDYLQHGYYPFFVEDVSDYQRKLLNAVEKIFYEDIPSVWKVKTSNIPVLKKILWLISTSSPFEVNIEKMSRELRVSKEYVYIYLEALERSGLIKTVFPLQKGYRLIRKPSKVYLDNTNLYYLFCNSSLMPEKGSIRECFFVNQVSYKYPIHIAAHGDFIVGEYTFEVGGKSKTRKQLKGKEKAFLVLDDVEIGVSSKIPLYLFGFLY